MWFLKIVLHIIVKHNTETGVGLQGCIYGPRSLCSRSLLHFRQVLMADDSPVRGWTRDIFTAPHWSDVTRLKSCDGLKLVRKKIVNNPRHIHFRKRERETSGIQAWHFWRYLFFLLRLCNTNKQTQRGSCSKPIRAVPPSHKLVLIGDVSKLTGAHLWLF